MGKVGGLAAPVVELVAEHQPLFFNEGAQP
jgi:hypothetical protein